MSLEQRSRPAGNGPARNAEEQSKDTAPDLVALSPDAFDAFNTGYQWGYVAGIERGRQLADDEAATLHREAVRVVRALANLDPRDPEADAERAAQREEWWTERRGEGRPV